jgi:MYXO-CTERM domain-containing protein
VLSACGPPEDRPGELEQALNQVCPPPAVVEGVDVSDGEGAINWAAVQGSGRAFAFTKATQGDYFTAQTFPFNWAAIADAGMFRSPYHFFDPTIDGVAQANHFLAVLDAAGGLQDGDLPPMLDIECPTSSNQQAASANCEYTGNSGWEPSAVIAQRAFDWLNTVQTATGRQPLIYSYPSWFADVGFTDAALAQYPLYIATLSNCPSIPAPWTTTVFWQYSFTGTVPGISSGVDLDRFVGTEAQLINFVHPPVDGGFVDGGIGRDAGSGLDGGSTHDAGLGFDGGTGSDGGAEADGGAEPDAGLAFDAGLGLDGGGGTGARGGCGCSAGSPEIFALLALARLLGRRARR